MKLWATQQATQILAQRHTERKQLLNFSSLTECRISLNDKFQVYRIEIIRIDWQCKARPPQFGIEYGSYTNCHLGPVPNWGGHTRSMA